VYARISKLSMLAAMAIALPASRAPFFTLGAGGAVNLSLVGEEARYGMAPAAVDGQSVLTISLGATSAEGSLTLSMVGDGLPAPGRYPVRTWEERRAGGTQMQALFVAGSPEHPTGAFRGESGWVTITDAAPGRIAGRFEIEARGFTAADPENENRRVTVRGAFDAGADSAIVVAQSMSSAVR
jgi:hypothetical protein